DEGTGPMIEHVGNFGSPFEPIVSPPSYLPHETLSAFDGLGVGGIWTIEVETVNASPVSAFHRWGLRITDEAVSVSCCAPDVNGDTILDVFDVLEFLQMFENHDPGADWNDDGIFDIFDITSYLGAFSQGC
ncbi:MAG: hypothetical protein KDA28_05415, partial [Phycisphaerales bacterium]|nr:hypothetical protein [Phycisphaerales bacterium]